MCLLPGIVMWYLCSCLRFFLVFLTSNLALGRGFVGRPFTCAATPFVPSSGLLAMSELDSSNSVANCVVVAAEHSVGGAVVGGCVLRTWGRKGCVDCCWAWVMSFLRKDWRI